MPAKQIIYNPDELTTLTLLGHVDEAWRSTERTRGWALGVAYLSIAAALRRQAGYTAQVRGMTRDAYAALPRRRFTHYGLYGAEFSQMLALTNLNDVTILALIDGFVAQLDARPNRFDAMIQLALALDGILPRSRLLERLAPLAQLAAEADDPIQQARAGAALASGYWRLGAIGAARALLDDLLPDILASPHEFQRFPAYLQVIRAWEQFGATERTEALWAAIERAELCAVSREKKLYYLASAHIKAGRARAAERLIQEIEGYDDQGWIQLIETYVSQGQPDAAEALLRRMWPRLGAKRSQAMMTIAIAYAEARRYERARQLDDEIPAVSSGMHADLQQAIASTGLRHGDLADAQAALDRLASDWPQMLKAVLDSQAANGAWDSARAIALSPERAAQRASLLRHLAGLLLTAGQRDEAADTWLQSQRQA